MTKEKTQTPTPRELVEKWREKDACLPCFHDDLNTAKVDAYTQCAAELKASLDAQPTYGGDNILPAPPSEERGEG